MLDAAHEQESNKPATHSSTQKPLPGRVWRHALRLMTPAVPARANGAGNGAKRAARAGGVPSEGGGRARWDGAKVGVSKESNQSNRVLYHSFTMIISLLTVWSEVTVATAAMATSEENRVMAGGR